MDFTSRVHLPDHPIQPLMLLRKKLSLRVEVFDRNSGCQLQSQDPSSGLLFPGQFIPPQHRYPPETLQKLLNSVRKSTSKGGARSVAGLQGTRRT